MIHKFYILNNPRSTKWKPSSLWVIKKKSRVFVGRKERRLRLLWCKIFFKKKCFQLKSLSRKHFIFQNFLTFFKMLRKILSIFLARRKLFKKKILFFFYIKCKWPKYTPPPNFQNDQNTPPKPPKYPQKLQKEQNNLKHLKLPKIWRFH